MTQTKAAGLTQTREISRGEYSHAMFPTEEMIKAFMNQRCSMVLRNNAEGERFITTVEVLSELPELIRKRYFRVDGTTWLAEKEVSQIIGLELSRETSVIF